MNASFSRKLAVMLIICAVVGTEISYHFTLESRFDAIEEKLQQDTVAMQQMQDSLDTLESSKTATLSDLNKKAAAEAEAAAVRPAPAPAAPAVTTSPGPTPQPMPLPPSSASSNDLMARPGAVCHPAVYIVLVAQPFKAGLTPTLRANTAVDLQPANPTENTDTSKALRTLPVGALLPSEE